MAAGLNHVTVLGNLGADPECRTTQSGYPVANIRLAVSERVRDGDGWRDATQWINVTAWGKLAEVAQNYLRKGSKALFTGRLRTREYTLRDGREVRDIEVVADKMVMLDAPPSRLTKKSHDVDDFYDDDIPF